MGEQHRFDPLAQRHIGRPDDACRAPPGELVIPIFLILLMVFYRPRR
jgi:hypothetical protein